MDGIKRKETGCQLFQNSTLKYNVLSIPIIRVSVDTLYRDGANDVSREHIQTAPLAH